VEEGAKLNTDEVSELVIESMVDRCGRDHTRLQSR